MGGWKWCNQFLYRCHQTDQIHGFFLLFSRCFRCSILQAYVNAPAVQQNPLRRVIVRPPHGQPQLVQRIVTGPQHQLTQQRFVTSHPITQPGVISSPATPFVNQQSNSIQQHVQGTASSAAKFVSRISPVDQQPANNTPAVRTVINAKGAPIVISNRAPSPHTIVQMTNRGAVHNTPIPRPSVRPTYNMAATPRHIVGRPTLDSLPQQRQMHPQKVMRLRQVTPSDINQSSSPVVMTPGGAGGTSGGTIRVIRIPTPRNNSVTTDLGGNIQQVPMTGTPVGQHTPQVVRRIVTTLPSAATPPVNMIPTPRNNSVTASEGGNIQALQMTGTRLRPPEVVRKIVTTLPSAASPPLSMIPTTPRNNLGGITQQLPVTGTRVGQHTPQVGVIPTSRNNSVTTNMGGSIQPITGTPTGVQTSQFVRRIVTTIPSSGAAPVSVIPTPRNDSVTAIEAGTVQQVVMNGTPTGPQTPHVVRRIVKTLPSVVAPPAGIKQVTVQSAVVNKPACSEESVTSRSVKTSVSTTNVSSSPVAVSRATSSVIFTTPEARNIPQVITKISNTPLVTQINLQHHQESQGSVINVSRDTGHSSVISVVGKPMSSPVVTANNTKTTEVTSSVIQQSHTLSTSLPSVLPKPELKDVCMSNVYQSVNNDNESAKTLMSVTVSQSNSISLEKPSPLSKPIIEETCKYSSKDLKTSAVTTSTATTVCVTVSSLSCSPVNSTTSTTCATTSVTKDDHQKSPDSLNSRSDEVFKNNDEKVVLSATTESESQVIVGASDGGGDNSSVSKSSTGTAEKDSEEKKESTASTVSY